jgi:hypothetical protein
LVFLAGLERDKTKRYVDTHRRIYQQELFEPFETFVVALGAELRRRASERLHAEPRIGGSLVHTALRDPALVADPIRPRHHVGRRRCRVGRTNPRSQPSGSNPPSPLRASPYAPAST